MINFSIGKQGIDLGPSLSGSCAGTDRVTFLEELTNNVFRDVTGGTGNQNSAHLKIFSRVLLGVRSVASWLTLMVA